MSVPFYFVEPVHPDAIGRRINLFFVESYLIQEVDFIVEAKKDSFGEIEKVTKSDDALVFYMNSGDQFAWNFLECHHGEARREKDRIDRIVDRLQEIEVPSHSTTSKGGSL